MSEPPAQNADFPEVQPRPPAPEPYRFPQEMEQYRPYLTHAGREEELMNSNANPFNNFIVWGMHNEMHGQLTLLHRLHTAGLLRPASEAKEAAQ